MRLRYLPLVPILAGCGASEANAPVFLSDFVDRSELVHCTPVPSMDRDGAEIGKISIIDDTTFVVLYPYDREVVVYGADLSPRHVIPFTESGPTGVRSPEGATLLDDTLVVVADQFGQSLRLFDLSGRDRGTVDLGFPPDRVQAAGDEVLVAPLVIASMTRGLVHAWHAGRVEQLGVATTRYPDSGLNAFANFVTLSAFPDGRTVVAHQFVVPFAYVLPPGRESVERRPIPLPDGLKGQIGRLPATPLDEEALLNLPTIAIEAAPDHRTGDLLYLVRTGRRRGEQKERALIRVDDELRYLRSYRFDVHPRRLAYLASRSLTLIADEEAQWYQCPTP